MSCSQGEELPLGEKDLEMWVRSKRMSLMVIKRTSLSSLKKLKKRFAKNDKAETNNLLASIVSIRYKEEEHKGVHYENV